MTSPTGGQNQSSSANQGLLNNWFRNGTISSTGWANNNFFANIDTLNPPSMKTFVYAPEVRVVIAHNGTQIDVSDDIIRTQLVRPENSVASFSVTLQNKELRYTPQDMPRFTPMDRIVVYYKKTNAWTQVFAGYLDKVPYRQLYDGEVEITASCTLKRLMHTWWNPDLAENKNLFNQKPLGSLFGVTVDNQMSTILWLLLTRVGMWNPADIHIQEFPMAFYNFMASVVPLTQQEDQLNIQKLKHMVLGDTTLVGPMGYAGSNPNAGAPGPTYGATGAASTVAIAGASASTVFYLQQIVAACDEKGLGPQVVDNNVGAGMVQAGLAGGAGGAAGTAATMGAGAGNQAAWQIIYNTGTNWQLYNRNSDGAILGVAAAMVDSGGGGTAIFNKSNPAVFGSDSFPNDGPNTNGTACGIFGQQSYPEWGSVDQRMNPKQAAGMFMAHLAMISGWRSMEPGAACQMVQKTASATEYTAAIATATAMVQAYRTSMASMASTVIPGGGTMGTTVGSAASATGASGMGIGTALGASTSAVSGAGVAIPGLSTAGALNPARAGKPAPDSEGAINWARTQLGMPYTWGAAGPSAYDCSGLVMSAFKAIGLNVGRTTDEMRATVPQIYPNTSVQRGDLVQPTSGHVVLYTGPTIIEASTEGVPVHEVAASTIGAPTSWAWVGRVCANGGADPTAPFNPPQAMGPGQPPAGVDQTGGSGSGTGGDASSSEGIALNLFSYMFTGAYDSYTAEMFRGRKAFLEGKPLIEMVSAVSRASLRSWSSGPDGSIMFWYPDYWGIDGKPAVLRLEDIELKDCRIDLSDDQLTTHVYVLGNAGEGGMGFPDETVDGLDTAGVVTVEDADTWLWKRLAQVTPVDDGISTGTQMLKRYGIRPLKQFAQMAGTHELEFLLACQVFMYKWSQRFETEISMTFMPELFPGMRVDLGDHRIQVYVTKVTHVTDYERGFHTTATIVAPSTPYARALMNSVNIPVNPTAFSNGPSGTSPNNPFRNRAG